MENEQDVVEEIAEESSTSEVVEESQETTDNRTEGEKGLITELQGMRAEMKDLKESSYRSQQELEYLRNTQQPEEEYVDPDEFVDRNDTEKMIQKELAPLKDELRTNSLNMLEAQMASVHPDYLDVVNKYGNELMNADTGVRDAILASPNPAQSLYSLSKSHPEYIKAQANKTRKDTVDKIAGNLESTSTIASQGGSAVSGKVDWAKASDKDIDAKLAEMGID